MALDKKTRRTIKAVEQQFQGGDLDVASAVGALRRAAGLSATRAEHIVSGWRDHVPLDIGHKTGA